MNLTMISFGLVICLPFASSLYFHLPPNVEKCFSEDVPSGQVLMARYTVTSDLACSVVLRDSRKYAISTHLVENKSPTGQIAHLSVYSGNHHVCVKCGAGRWSGAEPVRWEVSTEVGSELGLGYSTNLVDKTQVKNVAESLQVLLSRVHGIFAENDYERKIENQFKQVSESTATRIVYLSALLAIAIVIAALYSSKSLGRFLRNEKVI